MVCIVMQVYSTANSGNEAQLEGPTAGFRLLRVTVFMYFGEKRCLTMEVLLMSFRYMPAAYPIYL